MRFSYVSMKKPNNIISSLAVAVFLVFFGVNFSNLDEGGGFKFQTSKDLELYNVSGFLASEDLEREDYEFASIFNSIANGFRSFGGAVSDFFGGIFVDDEVLNDLDKCVPGGQCVLERVQLTKLSKDSKGKWFGEINVKSGVVVRAYGKGLEVGGLMKGVSLESEEGVFVVGEAFIDKYEGELGIKREDLVRNFAFVDSLGSGVSGRVAIVHFDQKHKGIEIKGSKTTIVISGNKIISYESNYDSELDINTTPKVNRNTALDIVQRNEVSEFIRNVGEIKTGNTGLVILRPGYFDELKNYILAWEIDLEVGSDSVLPVTYYVDARGGDILYRNDHTSYAAIDERVFGDVYPRGPEIGTENDPALGVLTDEGFDGIPVYAWRSGSVQSSDETGGVGYFSGEYVLENLSSDLEYDVEFRFGKPAGGGTIIIDGVSENGEEVPSSLSTGGYIVKGIRPYWVQDVDFSSIASPAKVYDRTYKNEASNVFYHLLKVLGYFRRGDPFNLPKDIEVKAHISTDDDPSSPIFNNTCNAASIISEYGDSGGDRLEMEVYFSGSGEGVVEEKNLWCEASSLLATAIYHEFSHGVTQYLYSDILNNTIGQAMREAYSDFWAASIVDDSYYTRGAFLPLDFQLRNLSNNKSWPNDFWYSNPHESGMILSGAMWEFREFIAGQFVDRAIGIDDAEKRIMLAIKRRPGVSALFSDGFSEFLHSMIVVDDMSIFGGNDNLADLSPNTEKLCEIFYENHGIWDQFCENFGYDEPMIPPETFPGLEDPEIFLSYQIPFDGAFVDDFSGEFPSIGSAEAGYSIEKRGLNGEWNSAGVTLAGSGAVRNALLAVTDSSQLINGCFYEGKLTSAGEVDTVTFQKISGNHDEMPRMVCVRRTGDEGGENDACDILALVGDPRPAYYKMADDDWRRGRGNLDSLPINWAWADRIAPGATDCFNIVGTNSDNNSGNDGLEDVFCAPNSGCSPVSFSGCTSSDGASCADNAMDSLEDVYYKVLYYHWIDKNGNPNSCNHDSCGPFESCWTGFGYKAMAAFGLRNHVCSEPRCEVGSTGDTLDGFYTLQEAQFSAKASYFDKRERDDVPVSLQCGLCGCGLPADSQSCNRVLDSCDTSKYFIRPVKDVSIRHRTLCVPGSVGCEYLYFDDLKIGRLWSGGGTNDFWSQALLKFDISNVDNFSSIKLNLYRYGDEGAGTATPWPELEILRVADFEQIDPSDESAQTYGSVKLIPSTQEGWETIDVTNLVSGGNGPQDGIIAFRIRANNATDKLYNFYNSGNHKFSPYLEVSGSFVRNTQINHDFELLQNNEIYGWIGDPATYLVDDGEICRSGTKCVKVLTNTWFPKQELPVEPNTSYTLNFWTKRGLNNPNNRPTRIHLRHGEEDYLLDCSVVPGSDWERKTCLFTTTDSDEDLEVFVILQGEGLPQGEYNYLDDLYISKSSCVVSAGVCADASGGSYAPYCADGNLVSYSCQGGLQGSCKAITYDCPYGCSLGRCLQRPAGVDDPTNCTKKQILDGTCANFKYDPIR